MDIVVISLERSRDRRAHMTAMLRQAGLDFAFARAIDADAGEHLAFPNYSRAAALWLRGAELVPGEIACFASHYTVWRQCVDTGRPMIVLEDDAELESNFGHALSLMPGLAERHGLIRLYGTSALPHRVLERGGGLSVVRCRRGPASAGAYALSSAAARTLMEHARRWHHPVDLYLNRFWQHGLPCIALLPYPVRPVGDRLPSTLEAERRAKPPQSALTRRRSQLVRLVDDLRRRRFLRTLP